MKNVSFFFFFLLSYSYSQNVNLEKLEVSHSSNFENYTSFPISCFYNVLLDSKGKCWLTYCPGLNYDSPALIGFDGYTFKPLETKESNTFKFNRPNFFFLKSDTIFGYDNLPDKSYFFYYDIKNKTINNYDSLKYNGNIAYNANKNHLEISTKQHHYNDSIYTYITSKDSVRLVIYDKDLNKKTYNKQNIPKDTNNNNFVYTTLKQYLIVYNTTTNTINSINLKNSKNSVLKKFDTIMPLYYMNSQSAENLSLYYKTSTVNSKAELYHITNAPDKENGILKLDLIKDIKYYKNAFPKYFKDNSGNYITSYKINDKLYLELTDTNAKTYDISDVYNYIDHEVNTIKSEDFFNSEIFVTTQRDFKVLTLESPYAITNIKDNHPIRGIESLDENKLIYTRDKGEGTQIINVLNPEKYPDLSPCIFENNKIHKIKNKIWGISSGNIYVYDIEKQTSYSIIVPQKINSLFFDNEGELYFQDNNGYIWNFNLAGNTSSAILDQNGDQLNFHPEYLDQITTKSGEIWFSDLSGLYLYDLKHHKLTKVNKYNTKFDYKFISICDANSNYLFLGTLYSGLVKLNKEDFSYTVINTNLGLCNNSVASITKDNNGFFWLGTYKGVSVIDFDLNVKINLYESDGVVNNESNRFSSKLLDDGRIAIGTLRGISIYSPELILKDDVGNKDISVYITEINYDKEKNASRIASRLKNFDKIILPPTKNNLSLELATNNLINPLKNVFAYRIEGQHMDWIELGNNPRLNLSNLRAGTHKLFIRGGDDKGNWSKNNIELIIVQKAFFYEQVWFYVVLICLLITSLLFIIKLLKTKIAKATAQLENDKNLIKQQAETLKKLDKAKSDFFTNITHEFRTPLTIIQGITNHVKSKSDSYNIKAINDIEDNSKQLLEMVNQILDLKKLESSEMKLKPVLADVVIFMDYIIDSYKYVAEQNGLKLSFKTDEEKLLMDYDPEKLKIVLTNLISNAIKFTPDDGTINVSLFKDTTSENANISISDTGLGFKETDENAVFTRFYQSDNNAFIEKKGSGLGLNYVQELLKLMKGTIQIDSKIYTGTNVVVTLPITQNETYKALEPEKKLAAVLNNGFKQNEFKDTQLKKNAYTILVVEDNSSIRSLLQQQFNSYNILTAKEGEEGINKALNEVPDLIISDVMMPNKSGYELTEILKENKITSHIPIILLTAKADQTSKIEGLKAKADAYIYKPYDTVELGLTVENLIEGRQTLQDIYKNLNAGSPPTTQPKEDVFIMNLRQVIEENMSANNFDVHYLCKSMNIGRAQLHNKVSALTGLSTTNYINHIRLLKAQELIKNSNLNFSEISNAIGFSSLSYFSKKFKEEFGLSPKQYSESYVQNKN